MKYSRTYFVYSLTQTEIFSSQCLGQTETVTRLGCLFVHQSQDRPWKPAWPSSRFFLRFVILRRKQHDLTTLLQQHAHYVSCSYFLPYISIFFPQFFWCGSVICFFPFQIHTTLSADVVLGVNAVLINKRVLFFSQWELAHIISILPSVWKFETLGAADKSLARNIFRCLRTKWIVWLERGACSCAELEVFSCNMVLKEACQATRTISATWKRELSSNSPD